MPPVLEMENVHCGYGKIKIVFGVSLTLQEKEIAVVAGPNGSGKSTLVKAVVNLVDITEGHVRFEGNDITAGSAEEICSSGIGYVPQTHNIFRSLSVEENLEMGSLAMRAAERREAVEGMFLMFPVLRERRGERGDTLSGGERQMLAIARALISKPRLLILDEPTAALAPKIIKDVMHKILEIRDTGVTILLVEQNLRSAIEIADKGLIMTSGTKVFEGSTREMLESDRIADLYFGGKKLPGIGLQPNATAASFPDTPR
jgi:branched-chain amino acid transport system ATP-binding protein